MLSVALGIYMDWSTRFEAWQGQPPRNIAGPLTPFSIEDLPTHYVGFAAAAKHMSVTELLTCYLGDFIATDEAPPHFALVTSPTEPDASLRLERLQNTEFKPLVKTRQGWKHVAWPPRMQLYAESSASGYWGFRGEETWYLNVE